MSDETTLSTGELLAELEPAGATKADLERWIRQGLPYTRIGRRRAFDPDAVESWLVDEGIVEREELVETRAEVAQAMGVSTRTFQEWRSMGCPGRPGAFDLSAIRKWRTANLAPTTSDDENISSKTQLDRLKARELELKIARMEGELIDVHEMRELLVSILVGPLGRLREDLAGTPYERSGNETIDDIIMACEKIGART